MEKLQTRITKLYAEYVKIEGKGNIREMKKLTKEIAIIRELETLLKIRAERRI